MAVRSPKKLSPKQARFVDEYLIDLHATNAAIRAGYSPKTARQIASMLLNINKVQEAIQVKRDRLSSRTEVTAERIVREFARIGFVDPANLFAWGPDGVRLKDSSSLSEDDRACVSEASETVTESSRNVRIKLHDKIAALNALAKRFGVDVPKGGNPDEPLPWKD